MKASEEYQQFFDNAVHRIEVIQKRLQLMIWVRSFLFFSATFCLVFGYFGDWIRPLTVPLGWSLVVAFFVAIVVNEHLRLSELSAQSDFRIFERLILRYRRQWTKLQPEYFLPEISKPDCAGDLDVDGEASLLCLINLTSTHPGQRELQSWIASPPGWPEVLRRQAAARALIPNRKLRIELIRRTSNTVYATTQTYGLTQWAESPSWLKQHGFAHLLSYVGPLLVAAGLGILFLGKINDQQTLLRVGFGGLVAGVSLNFIVTVFWGSWIHGIFHQVSGEHQATRQYKAIFEMLAQLPNDGGILDQARQVAVEQPDSAIRGIASLNRLTKLASLQRNVVFYLFYLFLQGILLWDFRILRLLEAWQNKYGQSVRLWFDALGRCEAATCVSMLCDEHPDWCFPTELSTSSENKLLIRNLGHALISNESRVCNDLTITSDKPLLLVTGSNMAGKSTFMRALGINLLLARTGSAVCASEFQTHQYQIASSIRVRDSLREGVSFFMAELQRLKQVVDSAVVHRSPGQPPLLFLLDEILQGTNSRERQIAVAHVVEQLIKQGTTGLLSTHDLDLAKVDEVARVAQIVHFREYFETDSNGKQHMRFDYVMRPGPTPTTNAIKLLEMVGLKS